MRKYHYAVLAAALLFPLTVWAGAQGDAGVSQEMMKITWMSQYTDSYTFKDMEERFGVKVISNGIFENDRERREIMVAAGDVPEFGDFRVQPPIDFYREGITRGSPRNGSAIMPPTSPRCMTTTRWPGSPTRTRTIGTN